MNSPILKFSPFKQRSLAYLILSASALFATSTHASNVDYDYAVQANSESSLDYVPAEEPMMDANAGYADAGYASESEANAGYTDQGYASAGEYTTNTREANAGYADDGYSSEGYVEEGAKSKTTATLTEGRRNKATTLSSAAQEPDNYADQEESSASVAAPAAKRINPVYNTRLMETIRKGDLAQVKWLLSNGADPEYRDDPSGMTPMHLAVKSGWVELAQLLADNGGDFKQTNASGASYLHIAAAANRLPMVKYLMSLGLDINATTTKGWTPLHHAARFDSYEVIDYLLSQGTNPNLYNSDGFTALGLAKNLKHRESTNLLQSVTQVAARAQPVTATTVEVASAAPTKKASKSKIAKASKKARRTTLLGRLGF